jgi:hypothetical protein
MAKRGRPRKSLAAAASGDWHILTDAYRLVNGEFDKAWAADETPAESDGDLYNDSLSDADWYRIRNRQKRDAWLKRRDPIKGAPASVGRAKYKQRRVFAAIETIVGHWQSSGQIKPGRTARDSAVRRIWRLHQLAEK